VIGGAGLVKQRGELLKAGDDRGDIPSAGDGVKAVDRLLPVPPLNDRHRRRAGADRRRRAARVRRGALPAHPGVGGLA